MRKSFLVLALTLGIATPAAADRLCDSKGTCFEVRGLDVAGDGPDRAGDTITIHGEIVAQADTTPDAGTTIPTPPVDTTTPPAPVVPDAPPTILQQLEDLRAAYMAIKDNTDKSARMLLWAALIATALKFALDLLGRLAGGKTWMPLVALGAAVPIGLLSHFAAGHSWFDSILVAGAGPGAVFVHELIKRFTAKKPVEATA